MDNPLKTAQETAARHRTARNRKVRLRYHELREFGLTSEEARVASLWSQARYDQLVEAVRRAGPGTERAG